ncbi:DUF6789 family protein [Actinophytocola sp.]|uniref:DUF6789 family protein n=1 Tax=Actinophytocola sp. TaxID=1872138 RepID=UPI002ED06258
MRKQSIRLAGYREDPLLFLLTLGAAATSIAALLVHLSGLIRMPYTLSFLTAPGMVFLLCMTIWTGRVDRPLIVNRLRVGFVAGLAGLLAYNATRWVVGALLSLHTSPFYSIYIFGALITGKPEDTLAAGVAGWLYHVSNGVTFAIIYTLVAGPARWWFGLLWGLVLETAMLVIYPSSAILRPPALAPFVIVSLISHALYGSVVGAVAQRHARPRPGG